ncbi:hypothetical protein BC628DRAFT_1504379 [Trametes gibbosa]|nr:hypothetical protein BC628DRAFT_1423381 [Trametes gibbosa]KAI0823172.1 hypothetical protein BC628DRAFT_1504379 [Trametes gibbosa]
MSFLDEYRRIVQPLGGATTPLVPSTPAQSSGSSQRPVASSSAVTLPLFLPELESLPEEDEDELLIVPVGSGSGSTLQHRRQRPDDFDDSGGRDLGEISLRMTKRLKTFGDGLCVALELEKDALSGFTELPSVAHMLVELMARMMEMQKANMRDSLFKYVETEDFQHNLQGALTTCLLSPNLIGYVQGIIPVIVAFMRDDPVSMRINPAILEFPDVFDKVTGLVPKLLSRVRGSIKEKLLLSLGPIAVRKVLSAIGARSNKANRARILNIAELTASLVPKNLPLELRASHWARIAFLRHALVKFNKQLVDGTITISLEPEGDDPDNNTDGNNGGDGGSAPPGRTLPPPTAVGISDSSPVIPLLQRPPPDPLEVEREYGVREFWIYVDAQLTALRTEIGEHHKTRVEQQAAWSMYLTSKVQDDLLLFTGRTTPGVKPVNVCRASAWQTAIEKRMSGQ